MNLSFAGCGFLGIYHVGVAGCFKKYAPHLLLNKVSGASAGAIAACCLLCDLPLDEMITNVLRVVGEARQSALGPFSPSFNIQKTLIDSFEKVLPEDVHERVSGKLHISMTRVYDGKNVVVSKFSSREDLLQALLASSFVPVFSGLIPPKFHGVRYMDGGFSNNLPIMDENTITVSPFCGESDICPRDYSAQLFHINVANTSIELSRHNFSRICKILFPPKLEILSNMCKQGFDDALAFLHRNNLINCTRCLSVQSTFTVSDTLDDSLEYDPECKECKSHRQEALLTSLPDTVLHLFQDAVETANKGLVNWIFKHRGMKLLSVLSLPYTLPADIVYATFTNYVGNSVETHTYKLCVVGNGSYRHMRNHHYRHILSSVPKSKRHRFMATAPSLGSNLWLMSEFLMNQLSLLLQKVNTRRQQVSANITCQLALTEYGNTKHDIESSSEVSIQNKMNINFTFNMDESTETHVVPGQRNIPAVLSRRSSMTINNADLSIPLEDDTVERILQETARHDAVMAYYYLDENNKVKVTEIYDVTDADSTVMLSPEERENNLQLEFDDGWNVQPSKWMSQQTLNYEEDQYDGLSDGSLEENIDGDSKTIFSDPESEWNNDENCNKSNSFEEDFNSQPNSLPESDQGAASKQSDQLSRRSSYAVMENIV